MKDFCRVKGLDFSYVNFITKEIDHQIEYSWEDLIKYALERKELYKFLQEHPDIVHLIKFSLQQPRSCSIHASAVVIVPNKNADGEDIEIFDVMPVRMFDGVLVSEWEGKYTDAGGFLKEDVLGLTQLDKFMNTIKLISKNRKEDIRLNEIDLEDVNTYKCFCIGNNEDVFQFNGNGMKRYSKKVKPDNIEDLIAMNALWRPGPMESNAHEDYAAIKHGKKKAQYDYGLKEVTKNTHSLYIYQEQIMQAVVKLGGFSAVESDSFRTMMKKFDRKQMDTYEEKFVQGAVEKGCDKHEAKKIWNKLLAFGGYGFNRSHSAAYSLISYWAQWFKVNYPLEFWTTSFQFAKNEIQVIHRISEMRKLNQGIDLKPPSVNVSTRKFESTVETNSIYWSLINIKGIGEAAVSYILEEREKHGKFKSYTDFIERVPKKLVNKSALTALIISGAFDEIEEIQRPRDRAQLLARHWLKNGEQIPDEFRNPDAKKDYFWIFRQKEITGYGDIAYKDLVSTADKKMAKIYLDPKEFNKAKDYTEVCICGVLSFFTERITKAGKQYCILEFICNNDVINVMMWEDVYLKYIDEIPDWKGKVIAISGKVKYDDWRECNALNTNENITKIILL